MGLRVPPVAIRLVIGALLGAIAWPALRFLLPIVPDLPRFLLTWGLFTFGPGVILAAWLTRHLDRLSG